jgi:hypothetical protein
MNRKKYIAVSVVALLSLWFFGVDRSWYVHTCPDCAYGKDVLQYRIFTIPIHETTHESLTITQRVAADLGVQCEHDDLTSWHKHRWWGLLVCRSPCINGTYRLITDDSWYDSNASAKVAALAAADNSIADDFARIVLVNHNLSFLRTVLDRAGVERTQ